MSKEVPPPVVMNWAVGQQSRLSSDTDGRMSDGSEAGLATETENNAFFCLPESSFIRVKALAIVKHKWFDNVITILVLLNCLFLALWLPTESDDHILNVLSDQAEVVFTVLFTVELSLKVIALGLVGHKGAYLRDGWNRMDCIVVLLSWSAYVPGMGNFLALRTMRLLRPLRTISNNKGMRVLVSVLIGSLPQLMDVFSLWMFVFVVLSIIGMQLWMGRFRRHCVFADTHYLPPDEVDKVCGMGMFALRQCAEGFVCSNIGPQGEELPNPNYGVTNFDNFGWAVLAVFQALSREGWTTMRDLTSSSWSGAANIYWLFLILFGSFFVVNLATAVIFSQFVKVNQIEETTKKGRKKRKSSVPVELKVGRSDAERDAKFPVSLWPGQKRAHKAVESSRFQNTVIMFIILNTACLAMEHYNIHEGLRNVLEYANYVFIAFFAIEMVFKLWALGIIGYLTDTWNLFDGVVVVISILELALNEGPEGLSVLRSFRLLRVLKVLRNADNIRRVVSVLVHSVRSVANFSLMISILIFTYALLGMQFFGGKLCEEWG
eukprot:CAMPEP_0182897770 /NCGR_PEP_ID=MMETSP0034_2-20130328/27086_1 /TAXON_ID=156128 /ORGANISM="Nephroselmis pyriformis, Strain CCMP717" /LENGTH=547 /DNA_ID=CAMNT_0025031707 /DNA_START=297 /DNA_END=1936 /DNA_ORIENTATION=+